MNTNRSFRLFFGLFALVLLLLAAGCKPAAPQVTQLDQQSDGKSITLKPGAGLAVSLPSNPTTGFSWAVDAVDQAVLAAQGEPDYQAANPDKQLVGGGGYQSFHFTAAQAGQTTLKLVYRRPWEKGVEPVQTFTLQVTVE